MMYGLAKHLAPNASPAWMLGTIRGFDGIDTTYTFGVYDISALPSGLSAVYMFCKIENGLYVPLYIGRAINLPDRLSGHEKKSQAIRLGATYLLVHTPPIVGARVDYVTAEKRLIRHYNPVLNTQHRSVETAGA